MILFKPIPFKSLLDLRGQYKDFVDKEGKPTDMMMAQAQFNEFLDMLTIFQRKTLEKDSSWDSMGLIIV